MKARELLQIVEKAQKVIRDRYPTMTPTLQSIMAQLEFIKKDLESAKSGDLTAKRSDVERIILGVQAVREIEPGDEELANLLFVIDDEYSRMHGIDDFGLD